MNTIHPDFQLELACKKIEKDRAFIVKEKMLKMGLSPVFNTLGTWMVSKGEYLRKQYAASKQTTTLAFIQDQAGVFKA